MNLTELQDQLRSMPMQALQQYANGMNPEVPPWLALSVLQQKQMDAQRQQVAQGAAQGQMPTIKDKVEQSAGLMALMGQKQQQAAQQAAMQNAQKPSPVPGGVPPAQPQPQASQAVMSARAGGIIQLPSGLKMASGGIVGYDAGGETRDPVQELRDLVMAMKRTGASDEQIAKAVQKFQEEQKTERERPSPETEAAVMRAQNEARMRQVGAQAAQENKAARDEATAGMAEADMPVMPSPQRATPPQPQMGKGIPELVLKAQNEARMRQVGAQAAQEQAAPKPAVAPAMGTEPTAPTPPSQPQLPPTGAGAGRGGVNPPSAGPSPAMTPEEQMRARLKGAPNQVNGEEERAKLEAKLRAAATAPAVEKRGLPAAGAAQPKPAPAPAPAPAAKPGLPQLTAEGMVREAYNEAKGMSTAPRSYDEVLAEQQRMRKDTGMDRDFTADERAARDEYKKAHAARQQDRALEDFINVMGAARKGYGRQGEAYVQNQQRNYAEDIKDIERRAGLSSQIREADQGKATKYFESFGAGLKDERSQANTRAVARIQSMGGLAGSLSNIEVAKLQAAKPGEVERFTQKYMALMKTNPAEAAQYKATWMEAQGAGKSASLGMQKDQELALKAAYDRVNNARKTLLEVAPQDVRYPALKSELETAQKDLARLQGNPSGGNTDPKAAIEWLKNNPNHPKAPAVRAKLKAMGHNV